MSEGWAARMIREQYENERPDVAAARAVGRFEREAIQVPSELQVPAGAKPWQVRQAKDAADLYRDLVVAGDGGVRLKDLGQGYGRDRRTSALKLLRGSGLTREATEDGLIVLRVVR